MLHRHRPARALRSANNNDLQVPSTSSRYGDRAFAVSTPPLWKALPPEPKTVTSLIYLRDCYTHTFVAWHANNIPLIRILTNYWETNVSLSIRRPYASFGIHYMYCLIIMYLLHTHALLSSTMLMGGYTIQSCKQSKNK